MLESLLPVMRYEDEELGAPALDIHNYFQLILSPIVIVVDSWTGKYL
jgi:hypothetical protein